MFRTLSKMRNLPYSRQSLKTRIVLFNYILCNYIIPKACVQFEYVPLILFARPWCAGYYTWRTKYVFLSLAMSESPITYLDGNPHQRHSSMLDWSAKWKQCVSVASLGPEMLCAHRTVFCFLIPGC